LLDKSTRAKLKVAGLLDQDKIITVKLPQTENDYFAFSVESFEYAFDIANSIRVQVHEAELIQAKALFKMMQFISGSRSKRTRFDVIVHVKQNKNLNARPAFQALG
jgi:hypothetical protein